MKPNVNAASLQAPITSAPSIDPGVRVGHVHLKVSDLQRSIEFYCGVLGFDLTQRAGNHAAFVSAGDYHHHIGLITWDSKGGCRPAPGTTGLSHVALLFPTRNALANVLARLVRAQIQIEDAVDHGVSEALYVTDPDGNGLELYRDRDVSKWPRQDDGTLAMYSRPLDLNELLALAVET